MDNYELNENFREACYLGDINLIKRLYHEQKPDVNSKNKINGWTALHWACKRNNFKLVEYLLSIGALGDVTNNDKKSPGEYTTDASIAALFNINKPIEISEKTEDKKFVPNFVKNPVFPYSDKSLYSFKTSTTTTTKSVESNNVNVNETKNEITLKIRDAEELDFIEIDLDLENTSFEQFKQLIYSEFEYDTKMKEIVKIRKLPNVLVRNTRDIKRFKENQEIEVIFRSLK